MISVLEVLHALGCRGFTLKDNPQTQEEYNKFFVKLPHYEGLDISWSQIQAKLKELEDEYEKQSYARSRAESYDPIPEQLDQIYHDMDGWKAKIKAVKDKYPKP